MPFNITRLSHVVQTSRDLDATRHFYESGLGLEVTFHDSERLCLRAIEESSQFSLMFEKVADDGPGRCRCVGYRMYSDDDVRRAHDWLVARNVPAAFVERPFQGLTLRITDAVGVPVEFCATMTQSENRMRHYHTHAGAKLVYLDHIQIATDDAYPTDKAEQSALVFDYLEAILAEAGAALQDVIKQDVIKQDVIKQDVYFENKDDRAFANPHWLRLWPDPDRRHGRARIGQTCRIMWPR